jgi:predicted DNA-binding protein
VASPITLRLDPELRKRVARLAKRKRTTTSTVLREAISTFVEREESTPSAYDQIKDLIGNVRGGDPTLSENAGRKFSEMLKARHKQS